MAPGPEDVSQTAAPIEMKCAPRGSPAAPMGAVYGLGVIGSAVYYIQAATSFWWGVLGVLKALVWPAFLTYELLRLAGA